MQKRCGTCSWPWGGRGSDRDWNGLLPWSVILICMISWNWNSFEQGTNKSIRKERLQFSDIAHCSLPPILVVISSEEPWGQFFWAGSRGDGSWALISQARPWASSLLRPRPRRLAFAPSSARSRTLAASSRSCCSASGTVSAAAKLPAAAASCHKNTALMNKYLPCLILP